MRAHTLSFSHTHAHTHTLREMKLMHMQRPCRKEGSRRDESLERLCGEKSRCETCLGRCALSCWRPMMLAECLLCIVPLGLWPLLGSLLLNFRFSENCSVPLWKQTLIRSCQRHLTLCSPSPPLRSSRLGCLKTLPSHPPARPCLTICQLQMLSSGSSSMRRPAVLLKRAGMKNKEMPGVLETAEQRSSVSSRNHKTAVWCSGRPPPVQDFL